MTPHTWSIARSALLVLLVSSPLLAQPTAVPVGAGSYAEYPPEHEGDGPAGMISREIYVATTNGLPIPTNDWWTDLVASQYAGDMWAYPLVVSADSQGVRVRYPVSFNAEGTQMTLGAGLRIGAKVDPSPPAGLTVIADFEGETYPAGWVVTGTAFGSGPAAGTLTGQSAVSGYLGDRLVNSFNGGDGPTGTLTSPPFTINHDYLHFLIAGGEHPDETEVRLLVDGQVVRVATADNSETLEWVTWDLSTNGLPGQTARIEIIDLASGGWGHICADQFVLSDDASDPGSIFSTDFSPVDARATDWSDWLVRFRVEDAQQRKLDVTMGHGLPFVWLECTDLAPRITSATGARYFDENGTVSGFPVTTDHLGVEFDGRRFGIFAPAGTQMDVAGATLALYPPGGEGYVVIGALTSDADLALLHQYASAIPRETRFDWTFDPEQGAITTIWTVNAESLTGGDTTVLQGWIPHHYRNTTHDLAFNGLEYLTPRGQLKCAPGNVFNITRPFYGVLPNLPAPQALGDVPHDFDATRMNLYLAMYAGTTSYGADTYWGGKDLVRLGRYMAFAHEFGNESVFETLRDTLRGALVDWFTYTPGEIERYFAAYPNWGALVGFNESYYSFEFTDHHFHYGYFAMATALLGMYDETFLDDYGPMAMLVSKEYANWDHHDTRFPFLRTFDPWRGHSYAGGLSSPGGNNQESSSEAVQSWAGLFLLGTMLGDDDMTAAGAMGYAVETEAMLEYWQDMYGQTGQAPTFSPDYPETITGILFDSGQAYATYFSGDPAWIYGIQWLPISPAMNHLVRDPAFAAMQYNAMMAERDAWIEDAANTISQMGTSLGNVVLGYVQLFDPAWVAEQMDNLWTAEDPIARDNYTGGITYYFTHSNRRLGDIQWDARISVPTSQVYYNPQTGEHSYVAYNPIDEHTFATVTSNGIAQGIIHLPPKTLVRATELLASGGAFDVLATTPAGEAEGVDPQLAEIAVIFSRPVAAAGLGGVTLSGPGDVGLSFSRTVEDLIAVFDVQGELEMGGEYTITVPAGTESSDGQILPADRVFTFRVEPEEEVSAALVAHYRLDETSGTVARDDSENAFDGTYVGAPPAGLTGAGGLAGTSVSFNGTTQEVDLGEPGGPGHVDQQLHHQRVGSSGQLRRGAHNLRDPLAGLQRLVAADDR